jgi:hypothetical protein
VVSWYGNGNRPAYAVQLYDHFVDVWISSNHPTKANEGVIFGQCLHKPVVTGACGSTHLQQNRHFQHLNVVQTLMIVGPDPKPVSVAYKFQWQ